MLITVYNTMWITGDRHTRGKEARSPYSEGMLNASRILNSVKFISKELDYVSPAASNYVNFKRFLTRKTTLKKMILTLCFSYD